jgi:hypothetical protein
MKKIKSFLFVSCILPLFVCAQPGFKQGSVITVSKERLVGSIKESFRSKGVITFLAVEGNRKVYSPSAIFSFNMDGTNFISYANDFYQEISSGTKVCLYQKVTHNRDKILYNGSDAVGITKATKGKIGDYYLLTLSKAELDLITRKTFEKYFLDLSHDNKNLQAKIKDGTLGYSQIVKVVDLYNN